MTAQTTVLATVVKATNGQSWPNLINLESKSSADSALLQKILWKAKQENVPGYLQPASATRHLQAAAIYIPANCKLETCLAPGMELA